MMENRALILPANVVEKIDANRGDLSRADFIAFLLEHLLKDTQEKERVTNHVTRQELQDFENDVRSLLRGFIDFFIAYDLELGTGSKAKSSEAFQQKLQQAASLVDKPPPRRSP
jgi:hypothetical protein